MADLFVPHPLEMAIGLERTRHRLVRELDRDLWKVDMTFGSMRALIAVVEASFLLHAGEVGRQMGVSRQAAAVTIKRLTEMGAVEVVDEGWARSVRATREGRRVVGECLRMADRTFQAFARLEPEERRELWRLLRKTEASLELLVAPW